MRLRVMVLHQGAFPGRSGAEAMAAATAAQARRHGHAVAFVTDPRGWGHGEAGVEIFDVRGPWVDAARRWRPDVLHLVDLVSARLAAAAVAAAEACGAPLVVTPASAPAVWEDAGVARRALAAAAAVLVLTGAEARSLPADMPDPAEIADIAGQAGMGRTLVIGQGAELPAAVPAGAAAEFRAAHGIHGPAMLFLARRLRSKGLWRLVAAMPRVRARVPGAVLVVAGPAGDDDCLQAGGGVDGTGGGAAGAARAAAAGIVDLGQVSDAGKRLALEACDLLCLPTEQDVFPVSFIEAWLCGKPVATTTFAGVEEVVRDGVDGVILDREPAALAEELARLLANGPRLAALGEAGRRRAARELTWNAVGDRIEAAYLAVSRRADAATPADDLEDAAGARRRGARGSGARAIVLAGGLGRRLRMDGVEAVKPLAPIGGIPLIEILLRQLAGQGFAQATLCITPATDAVRERIGDGRRLGLAVDYSRSETLLGTAGPLRRLADWTETALVVNGDLLTAFDYAALRRRHLDRGAAATLALVRPPVAVPFGVVDTDAAGSVRGIEEKPVLRPLCASGVYVLEPEILAVLGEGRIDMPEALLRLLRSGRPVAGHEIDRRWHDVGTAEALRFAEADFLAHTDEFLPGAAAAGAVKLPRRA